MYYMAHWTIIKKFQAETILKIPGHVGVNRVDVWFQDEARFGQQNSTTHIWAKRGTRPRVVKQQQFVVEMEKNNSIMLIFLHLVIQQLIHAIFS